MRTLAFPILLAGLAVLSACTSEGGYKLPGVYRIDVQQGNVIAQDMLDRLKPGMDKNQVRFVMGTPAVESPFHSDRWDYIYSISKGGGRREQRHVALYFQDEKLERIDGNVVASANKTRDELKPRAAPVEVELQDRNPGFFSRMFSALPFVGKDEARKPDIEPDGSAANPEDPVSESADTTAQAATVADGALGSDDDSPEAATPDEEGSDDASAKVEATADEGNSAGAPGSGEPPSESAEARRAVFEPEPLPLPDPNAELPSEDME